MFPCGLRTAQELCELPRLILCLFSTELSCNRDRGRCNACVLLSLLFVAVLPQTNEHPNPGKKFSARGFPRHCYLPDNEKGRKVSISLQKKTHILGLRPFFGCMKEELHLPLCRQVLKLLITAWDRRLIFTIGTSSTTGESDTVVWNEIHHKTEFGSNLTGHGYPDPNYLDNVLTELSAQGVGEDNLKD